MQIQLQHGDADKTKDLDGFENGGLVSVEFFGDGPDVLFGAHAEDGEAGTQRVEGFDSVKDVISIASSVYL